MWSLYLNMAPHFNQQLRERIIAWRYEDQKSVAEISDLADCSEATVFEVLRLYQTFGQVSPIPIENSEVDLGF